MDIRIKPSKLSGTARIPPSKSISHRALILASLADGQTYIKNLLESEDTLITLNSLKKLGVRIERGQNGHVVYSTGGKFVPADVTLSVGNSGTSARLLMGISCLNAKTTTITGVARLHERPFVDLMDALSQQGIQMVQTKYAFIISGARPSGGNVIISGSVSSQFISALLLIAPFARQDTRILIQDTLYSQPYVELTIAMMKQFDVETETLQANGSITEIHIPSNQKYRSTDVYEIEGDYSSASYFSAANALGATIQIEGLQTPSLQGDSKFPDIVRKIPGIVTMSDLPDVVPSLAVVGAFQKGTTIITSIGHLRGKESDRVSALAKELTKMGIEVEEKHDSLTIIGGQPKGAVIETYNDHRIAMAFAIAGLFAKGETIIKNADVVSKSYPNFWEDLQKLGGDITCTNR